MHAEWLIGSGIALIGTAILLLLLGRFQGRKSSPRLKEISLEELAVLWREVPASGVPADAPEEEPEFKKHDEVNFCHGELQRLYEQHIRGKEVFRGHAGRVLMAVMEMLDREGDCSSVVSGQDEPEKYLQKDTFDMLSGISLVSHSVHVAEEMVELFRTSPLIIPKALIAALGHDLGKIPAYRERMYSLGDHPLISVTILEGIDGYKELPYSEEISRAIADHHRKPRGLLGEKLKEADQKARRLEMTLSVRIGKEAEQTERTQRTNGSTQQKQTKPISEKEQSEREIFYSSSEEADSATPSEVDIEWFEPNEFLSELRPYINRLYGSRWYAFSMKNGYVYFQASVFEEVIRKLGKKAGDRNVALMDMDRELRRNFIYTVVNLLKRERDAVARGLIRDGFMGGYFNVRMRDGKEYRAYYIPLNAEVFGCTVSELENLKVGRLRDIVEVYPAFEEAETV